MKAILVTGADGFIGATLCKALIAADFNVRGAVRSGALAEQVPAVAIGDINAATDWRAALTGIDVVVHLAARVHVMEETSHDPLALFRDVNLDGTKNLALQAVASGVKRFIYISTIKVNGESAETPFSADIPGNPQDAYAASKWEAEQELNKIAAETGLETVIIRPPLVYGPGVKGNFLRLLKLVDKGWPIPLGAVENKRSMVYVDNLCDLIRTCIQHPRASGQVFLVSDHCDISTPELIRLMACYLNHPARLIAVPVFWLYWLTKLLGRGPEIERLCGSLHVDIQKTKDLLDWQPPYTVEQGVRNTVHWFQSDKTLAPK